MSFFPTGEYKFDMFRVKALHICPGAIGVVETRGWEDPSLTYQIYFKNGTKFEGADHVDVHTRAETYANGLHRLTGKYP